MTVVKEPPQRIDPNHTHARPAGWEPRAHLERNGAGMFALYQVRWTFPADADRHAAMEALIRKMSEEPHFAEYLRAAQEPEIAAGDVERMRENIKELTRIWLQQCHATEDDVFRGLALDLIEVLGDVRELLRTYVTLDLDVDNETYTRMPVFRFNRTAAFANTGLRRLVELMEEHEADAAAIGDDVDAYFRALRGLSRRVATIRALVTEHGLSTDAVDFVQGTLANFIGKVGLDGSGPGLPVFVDVIDASEDGKINATTARWNAFARQVPEVGDIPDATVRQVERFLDALSQWQATTDPLYRQSVLYLPESCDRIRQKLAARVSPAVRCRVCIYYPTQRRDDLSTCPVCARAVDGAGVVTGEGGHEFSCGHRLHDDCQDMLVRTTG